MSDTVEQEQRSVRCVIKAVAFVASWGILNATTCSMTDILKRDTPSITQREGSLKEELQDYQHEQEMQKLRNELERIMLEKNRPVIVKEE